MRAAASHTAALAGEYAAYQAMFQRYGLIEGRDIGEMVDIAAGLHRLGLAAAAGTARRHLHGVGRRRRLDGGCLQRPPASRCPSSMPRRARSIDVHLPSYGTSQNPVDATAQAVSKIGYAGLAELVLPSPVGRRHRRRHDGRAIRTASSASARRWRASPPRRRSRS